MGTSCAARAGCANRTVRREGPGASDGRYVACGCAQQTRLRRALAIVGLLVATMLVLCVAFRDDAGRAGGRAGSGEISGTYVGRMWGEVMFGEEKVEEALAEQGMVLAEEDLVPAWFRDEVFLLEGAQHVVATPDWSVVSYEVARAPSEEVLDDLACDLASKGWVGYESGVEGSATFVKEGGTCSWMVASCAPMPDVTNVVLRIRHA